MSHPPLSGKKYFHLDDQQRLNWLRLIRSENVGPAIFRDLISHYGSARLALEGIPELARRGGSAARIRICSEDQALREIEAAQQIGARFVGIGEPDFPNSLRMLEACPPLLCVMGSTSNLLRPSLAVVGSRNASISGLKIASNLSAELGQSGIVIVSGLARGVDTAAHKAALSTGTTAVFAGGLDCVFPEENQQLAKDIVAHDGTLVSEMPISWQPRAKDFPRRNRIITGLSQAVLVVEAARRSGSLITARLANEAGRPVLAVPGSPLDPRSEGTNRLIREGATLVGTAEDVLEALAPLDPEFSGQEGYRLEQDRDLFVPMTDPSADLDDGKRETIMAALGPAPVHTDDIIQFSGAAPGEVQLALLELSLAGVLERHPGGLVSRIAYPPETAQNI